ncbi:hypothetical protein OIV83_002988 [Microbotryomycetes sp. JL201]|nr:hypothetical protein OIV83_002988 [Microbotryomycetes sp. JL201]
MAGVPIVPTDPELKPRYRQAASVATMQPAKRLKLDPQLKTRYYKAASPPPSLQREHASPERTNAPSLTGVDDLLEEQPASDEAQESWEPVDSDEEPALEVELVNSVLPPLPASLAGHVPPCVVDAKVHDGACPTFSEAKVACTTYFMKSISGKQPLPSAINHKELLNAGFIEPWYTDTSSVEAKVVSACHKDRMKTTFVRQNPTSPDSGTIIALVANLLNKRGDRVLWSVYRITKEFIEKVFLRLSSSAVGIHFVLPRDQAKVVALLQLAEALHQSILDSTSPLLKHHSKDIVVSDFEHQALYSIATSGNASVVGMGLNVLSTKGHPIQMSTESASLMPLPVNCATAAELLHDLDAEWADKVTAGVLLRQADIVEPEDELVKEAMRISRLHFAKYMRQMANAHRSRGANVSSRQAIAPRAGFDGPKFLQPAQLESVKAGALRTPHPDQDQAAIEAALQADLELPPVGSRARVACLSCGRIFETCRRTLSLGSSAVFVEGWTDEQLQAQFKHSKTNLGDAVSYDLILKWLDALPEDRVLVGEEAITNSLRCFLNSFQEHPQYTTLARQALTWQHLSSCLSNRLGPDVYIGNARSGYNILGASIHPDRKQTVNRLRARGLGPKRSLGLNDETLTPAGGKLELAQGESSPGSSDRGPGTE